MDTDRDKEHRSLLAEIVLLISSAKNLLRAEANFQKSRFSFVKLQMVRIVTGLMFFALMLGLALFAILAAAIVALAPQLTPLAAGAVVALITCTLAGVVLLTLRPIQKRLRRLF